MVDDICTKTKQEIKLINKQIENMDKEQIKTNSYDIAIKSLILQKRIYNEVGCSIQ